MKQKYAIASFYDFIDIKNPEMIWQRIILEGRKKSVFGTVIIAQEGFNGSIAGPKNNVQAVIDRLASLASSNTSRMFIKWNYADSNPFSRFKVKLKPEIISLKYDKPLNISAMRGKYIDPTDWDKFISREDVIVIDTRNTYEIERGKFKGAVNPYTQNFRDFPSWAQQNMEKLQGKKIAMYCTGGVRCEKSTAYLTSLGINMVYHLRGGILQYLQETGNKSGMWEGDCFVFDERIALDHQLSASYSG